MAYLRKLPNSKFWIGGFTLPNGTRTQRSTKLTDRKEAMKLVMKWEEVSRNRTTEAQFRRVISDIHEQIHGNALSSPDFDNYATAWLERKRGEIKPITHSAYRHAIEEFVAFLGDKANQSISYITTTHIAAWRDGSAKKASARTANNKLKILRTLFASAWRDGLISDNPAAKVSGLKTLESTRRPFTLRELSLILDAANEEWKGMILAGLYTGQRLKDLASLTWNNIDLQENVIRFVTSKTGRRQSIPIAEALRKYLEALPSTDNPKTPLFPSLYPYGLKTGGSSVLSQSFYQLLENVSLVEARLTKDLSKGQGGRSAPRIKNEISFHSLRHTATSLLKAAGVSESVAMEIIGHESADISRNYTHVEEEAKRKAIALLPDITNSQ